jgi:hypothetical protein
MLRDASSRMFVNLSVHLLKGLPAEAGSSERVNDEGPALQHRRAGPSVIRGYPAVIGGYPATTPIHLRLGEEPLPEQATGNLRVLLVRLRCHVDDGDRG